MNKHQPKDISNEPIHAQRPLLPFGECLVCMGDYITLFPREVSLGQAVASFIMRVWEGKAKPPTHLEAEDGSGVP